MMTRSWIAIVVLVSTGIAGIGFACSSKADDGGSCDQDSDCKSGRCVDGTCGGSTCTCTTAGVCKTGTSCGDGYACVNESTSIPTCRRLCPDGKTGCLTDEHCDTDNVCHFGAAKPSVVFAEQPRPCSAFLDCPFLAKVLGGSGSIDHFDFLFDDDASVTSIPDALISHQYALGSHTTSVTAFDHNGTTAKASTTDNICVDGVAIPCAEGLYDCCSGSCTPEGGCR